MSNRACSVCERPERQEIDNALAVGVPGEELVRKYPPLTAMSVSRHRRNHLVPGLAVVLKKQQAKEERGYRTTAQRIEDLYLRAERILNEAEAQGQGSLALAGVRELRGLVELLAKITGELDDRPQVQVLNVQTSPEWVDLRSLILQALGPYPEAALAVARALDSPKTITA
jgi:hypothetical protein